MKVVGKEYQQLVVVAYLCEDVFEKSIIVKVEKSEFDTTHQVSLSQMAGVVRGRQLRFGWG